jgi:hypothetical protein
MHLSASLYVVSYISRLQKSYKTKTAQEVWLVTSYSTVKALTPNGHYIGRTVPLTSRRCILNIYSTNIRTEYFKHAA